MTLEQAVDEALVWLAEGLGHPSTERPISGDVARLASAPAIEATAGPSGALPTRVGEQARPGRQGAPAGSALTRREREVARLIAQGSTNRQIAEALVISEGTAANYVQRVMNRLDLHNRAQVAAWAVEHGLHAEPSAPDLTA